MLYLKDCNFFALQIDESTDIINMAQLMVFIHFDRNDEIIEEFLFCKPLKSTQHLKLFLPLLMNI